MRNSISTRWCEISAALIGAGVVLILHVLLVFVSRPDSGYERESWSIWEKLVYLGVMGAVGVLGFTSFYAVIQTGVMGGWMLFAHMFGAGAFVVALPVIAITWAESSRFGQRTDLSAEEAGYDAPFFWIPKVMFWILLGSGLVVIMTMLLSMLPLFGTDGLLRLLDIHRYAGLLAVIAAIFHLYGVVLQRVGLR